MVNFLKARAGFKQFKSLPKDQKKIVFYSEGGQYWVHFEQVIQELTCQWQQPICYVTSSLQDPGFTQPLNNVRQIYIGEGIYRTWFFNTLDVPMLVLTMPDLHRFHLKRSIYPVHYVYLFHSLVSSHRVYRPKAFDHYDTILTAGPHHEAEIRQTEQIFKLKPKNLIPHGYGRLDSIYQQRDNVPAQNPFQDVKNALKILIAPSWGPDNLLNQVGEPLIDALLQQDHQVLLRPHPHAIKTDKKRIDALIKQFKSHPLFHDETNVADFDSLLASDVMITDWSGVAFDYAFGLEKPVIFIDVPAKTNNPDFNQIHLTPIEERIREQLGAVLSPNDLNKLPELINDIQKFQAQYLQKIRQARSETVHHFMESGQMGAKSIMSLLDTGQN